MSTKLPFLQFYPSDWVQDTRPLSLAAKGAWIDIICLLWKSQIRGLHQLPIIGWARVIGATVDQTVAVIDELATMQVAEVEKTCNGDVTLKCRRMLREENVREQARLRVQKHRSNELPDDVTPSDCEVKRFCNGDVTPDISEVRSHRSEKNNTLLPSAKSVSIKRRLTDLWCKSFEEIFGLSYKFDGTRDGKGADALLKVNGHTPEELLEIARRAWAKKDSAKAFWCKHAVTLSGFASRFNEIRSEIGDLKVEINGVNHGF